MIVNRHGREGIRYVGRIRLTNCMVNVSKINAYRKMAKAECFRLDLNYKGIINYMEINHSVQLFYDRESYFSAVNPNIMVSLSRLFHTEWSFVPSTRQDEFSLIMTILSSYSTLASPLIT